jgi:hypothetical protein
VLVPARAESLGLALKHAHGRYASYWNAVHHASGTELFSGTDGVSPNEGRIGRFRLSACGCRLSRMTARAPFDREGKDTATRKRYGDRIPIHRNEPEPHSTWGRTASAI